MAKKIGLGFLALLAVLILVISTRPESFRVERSAQVNAPAAAVYPLINDFHKWNQWSPFEKIDPNMKRNYEGPGEGPGAVYTWAGNDQAGEGRMTITDVKPNELVNIKLEFTKPFAATNQAIFTLQPSQGGTRVTWAMEGKNNFVSKAMSLFMSMDSMVGGQFEKGLADLNTAAQSEAKKQASASPAAPEKPSTGARLIPAAAGK